MRRSSGTSLEPVLRSQRERTRDLTGVDTTRCVSAMRRADPGDHDAVLPGGADPSSCGG